MTLKKGQASRQISIPQLNTFSALTPEAYQPRSLQGAFSNLTIGDILSWGGLGAYMPSALIPSRRGYPASATGVTTGTP